jgi:hypothetical protein
MGRKKYRDKRIPQKLYLPESVLGQVSLILMNPLTQKIEYGALSELVSNLLAGWVAAQQKAPQAVEGVAPLDENGDNYPVVNLPNNP